MPYRTSRTIRCLTIASFVHLATACSSGVAPDDAASDVADAALNDSAPQDAALAEADAPEDTAPADTIDQDAVADAGAPYRHTFAFHPDWDGVTAVTVVGSFGTSSDWHTPFATLTRDAATGTWSATTDVPPGMHTYLFHVTGDAAAASATYARYVLDPHDPSFVACPTDAPTYNTRNMNPCSVVSDGATTAPSYHVRGTVVYDAAPIAGYLAVLERDETGSHHMFVDRMTVGADGAFDMEVAPGTYRVQVLYPTMLNTTDAMRDPTMLNAARRALSSSFMMAADKALPPAEMAYHGYAAMMPQSGTATLPATLQFTVVAGAASARASVYYGATIGDPWWSSTNGTATSASFDGTFNTPQAMQPMAMPATQYYWGTWQTEAPVMGVTWTRQSMVFPIEFM